MENIIGITSFGKLQITPLKFGVIGFYTVKFQNLDFTPYVLEVFGFYSLKFWGVWILYPKVLEFEGVKSKQH